MLRGYLWLEEKGTGNAMGFKDGESTCSPPFSAAVQLSCFCTEVLSCLLMSFPSNPIFWRTSVPPSLTRSLQLLLCLFLSIPVLVLSGRWIFRPHCCICILTSGLFTGISAHHAHVVCAAGSDFNKLQHAAVDWHIVEFTGNVVRMVAALVADDVELAHFAGLEVVVGVVMKRVGMVGVVDKFRL
jgi:hypothetical protein